MVPILLFETVNGAPTCNNDLDEAQNVPCDGVASSGAFINLCGICVGGQTGLPPTQGIDQCQVCFGSDECLRCDGQLNNGEFGEACQICEGVTSSCPSITGIEPGVLDRAVDSVGTVLLRGACLNRTAVPDINCTLVPEDRIALRTKAPIIEMTTVEDDVIEVEVIFTDQRGFYSLECNSSNGEKMPICAGLGLSLVNSLSLAVTGVAPKNAVVDVPFQAVLTVPNVTLGSSVWCYVKDKGVSNTRVLKPASVSEGQVVCENFTPRYARVLEFGVVYTEDAAMEGDSTGIPGEITVNSPAPVMTQAILSDDLRNIYVTFDQNVNGSENCDDILTVSTLQLLGNGVNCSFLANNLVIKLGRNPTLQINSPIQLAENSQVYRAFSDKDLSVPATGSIALMSPPLQKVMPNYRVAAPRFVCPNMSSSNTSIRLVSSGGQNLKYFWTVNFDASAVPSRGQSENLRVWNNVRRMKKTLKETTLQIDGSNIPVNTTMFMPGIPYEFNVAGANLLGLRGDTKKFLMEIAKSRDVVDLILLGPDSLRADIEHFVEARITSCDPNIEDEDLNYEWNIIGNNIPDIDFPRGKRLRLPTGILQGGETYRLSCRVTPGMENTTIIASGELTMQTSELGFVPVLGMTEFTVGTGQPLRIDASQTFDPDNKPGEFQFQWCCRQIKGGSCLVPEGGPPTVLENKYIEAFKQSVLEVPAGSLPIGEYNFTVHVYKDENDDDSVQSMWTRVLVIPGSPPIVNITPDVKLSVVDPTVGVTIPAAVSGIRAGCRMWWSVVHETGYGYFDLQNDLRLGDVVKVSLEEAMSGLPRENPLTIPGPLGNWMGLQGDTKYKLRLTTACPVGNGAVPMRDVEGYADVVITTNTPPIARPLEVVPNQGEALVTQFEFSTKEAYDSMDDMPLLYNFGYRIQGKDTNTIFSSSNEVLQAYTVLPAEDGKETLITPILEVCDARKLCSVSEGQQVKTRSPTKLSATEIEKVLKMFASLINLGQYAEALSLARTSLQALKHMTDATLYEFTSRKMENIIRKELAIRKDRLDKNPASVTDSLDFLDMTLSTLKYLPMSDTILQDLLNFKDAILDVMSSNNVSQSNRVKRETSQTDQSKNDLVIENVKVLLKASELPLKEKNEKYVRGFLSDVDKYVMQLCQKPSVKLRCADGDLVTICVQRLINLTSLEVKLTILDSLNPGTKSDIYFVTLGPNIRKEYWPPICYANTIFLEDYHSIAYKPASQDDTLLKRLSPTFGLWLIRGNNPKTYKQPIFLQLPIKMEEVNEMQQPKCAVWADKWNYELCDSKPFEPHKKKPFVECECSQIGYYSVFGVKLSTTTTESTTVVELTTATTTSTVPTSPPPTSPPPTSPPPTSPTITTEELPSRTNDQQQSRLENDPDSISTYSLIFRIDEDFNTTVGDNEDEFVERIKDDILRQINMSALVIKNIEIFPGSIVVVVTLVDTKVISACEVIIKVTSKIQNGELTLHGVHGNELHIPSQDVVIRYLNADGHRVLYATGSIVILSTVAVVFLLITGSIFRKRKETAMVKRVMTGDNSNIPTYRQFQFEKSLDGTEASLAQYRSSIPTMGTVSTFVGFDLQTGLGTQLNFPPIRRRTAARYDVQSQDNRHLQVSNGQDKAKDSFEKKMKNFKDSTLSLVKNEISISYDEEDSGIIDGDGQQQPRRRIKETSKKKLGQSVVSLDCLPGTPEEDP